MSQVAFDSLSLSFFDVRVAGISVDFPIPKLVEICLESAHCNATLRVGSLIQALVALVVTVFPSIHDQSAMKLNTSSRKMLVIRYPLSIRSRDSK